jgi:hypothetical protein
MATPVSGANRVPIVAALGTRALAGISRSVDRGWNQRERKGYAMALVDESAAHIVSGNDYVITGRMSGLTFSALIDTGASNSFLSESFANRLPPSLIRIIDPVRISSVFNTIIATKEVTCNFSLKGQKFNEKFVVVPIVGLEYDVILGRTFINSNRVKCDEWTRKVTVETGTGTEANKSGEAGEKPQIPEKNGKGEPFGTTVGEKRERGSGNDEKVVSPDSAGKTRRGESQRGVVISGKDHEHAVLVEAAQENDDDDDDSEMRDEITGLLEGLGFPRQDEIASVQVTADKVMVPEFTHKDFLNSIEDEDVRRLVDRFADVFVLELPPGLCPKRALDVEILPKQPERPWAQKCYPMSLADRQFAVDEVERLLKAGRIEKSTSPWAAPCLVAKSGSGKRRLVINYQKLNEQCSVKQFPFKSTQDVFDALGNANYFSKLDGVSSFHQQRLSPETKYRSGFSAPNGHFEWKVSPFGFLNSPQYHAQNMDAMFAHVNNLELYVDDFLGHTGTKEQHLELLEQLFETARKEKYYFRRDKAELFKKEILFLGHKVSAGRLHMDEQKLQAIQNLEAPKSVTELRRFLGKAGMVPKVCQKLCGFDSETESASQQGRKMVVDGGT